MPEPILWPVPGAATSSTSQNPESQAQEEGSPLSERCAGHTTSGAGRTSRGEGQCRCSQGKPGLRQGDGICACVTATDVPAQRLPSLQAPLRGVHGVLSVKSALVLVQFRGKCPALYRQKLYNFLALVGRQTPKTLFTPAVTIPYHTCLQHGRTLRAPSELVPCFLRHSH